MCCAFRKMVLFCFVLFCLKIKVKRDISRKVRTRSGFRDRNVPIEEQEGIIFSKGDTV